MTEVAFLTLFLGLTAGTQDVSLAVTGPAARIEIWLDAERVGEIAHAPWQTRIDFGPTLLPHRLEARALDAQGAAVARRTQILNLPRPAAETDLLLEYDKENRVVAARLVWQSVTNGTPERIAATLDGKPRAVERDGRIDLAATASNDIHVLSAEVRFDSGASARADVAFGGDLGESSGDRLAAIPLAGKAVERAHGETLKDAIVAQGMPRPIVAIEEGGGSLLVVRQPSAYAPLCRGVDEPSMQVTPRASGPMSGSGPGRDARLSSADTLQFLWPWVATESHGTVPFQLFASSPEMDTARGRLDSVLCTSQDPPAGARLRLVDAVALAGLRSATGAGRRVVLLILGPSEPDDSQFDIAAVRAYLHAVHVPLVVWTAGVAKSAGSDTWGAAERVDSPPALRRAMLELLDRLASQRVAWLGGDLLPNEVTLSSSARAAGVRFADEDNP